MSPKSINYLGFDSLPPIDKKFIKIEFLKEKFRSITTNNLLNGVKNLKDSDPNFKLWLDEKQRKQLRSTRSRKGSVLPVILAKGRGITKRKKKRKGKSKKKRVRKGGKTRRRS